MTGELGHLLLILALVAAAVQALAGLGRRAAPRLAAVALGWQAVGLGGAMVALALAFVQHDFSLSYVAQHSHSTLPLAYCIAAVWGGHEGSMLLWALVLVLWSLAAAALLRRVGDGGLYATRVLGVLALVSMAMLGFILFTSNPFLRLLPAAAEGQSLNPLLQDPGLVLHPPLLYLGYVGTAVPFAMTLATLAFGAPADWVRRARPFTALALAFLSVGIALGSWWAYYELGWGGWWFWDPVENASLMPWMALAALLHVQAARDQRGSFAHWSALLSLGGFVLALLGTFLVRSGVLTSVHAFASDPRRGSVMLAMIAATLLGSFALYARHAGRLEAARERQAESALSRDKALALNNLVLVVACASVLLGTLYPLVMDALSLGKLSVGAPYFDAVMAPLLLPALVLLVPAAWLRWGSDQPQALLQRLRPTLWAMALGGLLLPPALLAGQGRIEWGSLLALWLALGVAASTLHLALQRARRAPLRQFGAAPAGMVIAHLGVAVFVVGVAMVKGYGIERDVRMAPGESHLLDGCPLRLEGVSPEQGPNYSALVGRFERRCPGEAPLQLRAEKRAYVGSAMPMTESAIDWGLSRDLYVALGEPLGSGTAAAWSVRVQVKPFMRWVWLGVLLMAVGATLAGVARRLRRRVPAVSALSPVPAEAATPRNMPRPLSPLPQEARPS
ncbi:cytochrome c-type biogenesis protein CcmF [Sphaerotilus hippei]|uniref:Cytochrome c-type biogenesis protein CcmF n=1 Tax=Sphaerotilus hippei TaxID=744406 RepID=A0A318GVH7_9BURK|nr:heme lyase CcmF/NrfE family subunit [Sphaerotilus hippei]PXW93377.1 cytochrome c-type biogenesis protein CcmF [Sphaerotilus hippei]